MGAVDESFLVKKTGKTYALECNGTNDGEEGLIVEFDIMSVEIGIDSNGDASTAPVVRRVESVAADLVAATLASAGSRKSLEALRLAIVEKGIPPEGSSYPDGAMVVTEDAWRSRFYATDPEAKPDTMAKRFKRAKTELIEKGKVINIGSWFWPQ